MYIELWYSRLYNYYSEIHIAGNLCPGKGEYHNYVNSNVKKVSVSCSD